MRTCPNCGASVSETDEFCGNCGTYLAWLKPAGEQPPEQRRSPPERPPQAAAPGAEAAPRTVPPAAGAPLRAAPPVGEEQPGAVAPSLPVAPRRAPVVREATGPASNGPVCGNCGTVNPAGAKFCRHCGNSLAETAAPAAIPWWRRLRWRHRRGFRVGGSPWPRRIVVLAVLAALVVAGFLVFPLLGQDLLDKLSTAAPIAATSTTGSGAVPGHPVTAADDGVTNRYWGAPAVGAWVQFRFAQPFRLLGVVITPGASTDPTAFDSEARPTAVDLVITTSTGSTTTLPVTLADKPGPETTNTGVSDVVAIRLVIRTATPRAPGQSIALGEIEFFTRS